METQNQIEINEYEEDNDASYDFNEEEMNVSINEERQKKNIMKNLKNLKKKKKKKMIILINY